MNGFDIDSSIHKKIYCFIPNDDDDDVAASATAAQSILLFFRNEAFGQEIFQRLNRILPNAPTLQTFPEIFA